MKKLISILLSVLLLLPVIASFGVGAAAESTYEELWAEKVAYESSRTVGTGSNDGFVNSKYSLWPTVLLYSSKADQFTYETKSKLLYYPENESNSWHGVRAIVRDLGLTKEEIVAAYQKMNEDPESIRELLSFVHDREFALTMSLIRDDLSLSIAPPNFVLEALTIEDEAWAKRLLSVTGAVYLPEYDEIYSTFELFGDAADSYKADFDGFFDGIDLTTREFQYYFQNLKRLVYEEAPNYDEYMFGTVLPKIAYLEAEMAKQLAAKETGDSTVTSVLVLAIAVPTLATLVVVRKKRKI